MTSSHTGVETPFSWGVVKLLLPAMMNHQNLGAQMFPAPYVLIPNFRSLFFSINVIISTDILWLGIQSMV
jgi:hypothetical protein